MSRSRLIDVPVQYSEDEALGVSMYADVLTRFIISCETPITIGIQGDWGIGKTSMLNMVREMLNNACSRKIKYHVIYFNTWQYSQFNREQYLGLSILKGIMAEIQELESLKNIKESEKMKTAIKSFSRFITKLGNQVLKEHSGLDLQAAVEDEESNIIDDDIVIKIRQMKDEFSKLVKALVVDNRDRLIIMVDDLDRIKPVKALEFLEAIKNFLDVESCIFVMAVDYSVIQSGMIEKLGRSAQELQGKSYFDKIIQVPFVMPSISYEIDKYVMSLLGWNYSPEKDTYEQIEGEERDQYFLKTRARTITKSEAEFFTNITQLTVGNNPRSIKRAVNYANLLRMVVQSQWANSREKGTRKEWSMADAKVLYPLSCMQLAWPELFAHFSKEPNLNGLSLMQDFDYLENLKGMKTLLKRVHNPEETMSNITGFIDEYIALIDANGDGTISHEEFSPIFKMMVDANLTSARYIGLEEDWKKLQEMIMENMKDKNDTDMIKKVFALFRNNKSKWHHGNKFSLLSAGKKFYNITWSRKQIGSFASTQSDPVQFYLKGEFCIYNELVDDDTRPFISDVGSLGHYGIGNIRVDILKIAQKPNGIEIMNSIFDAMVRQM